MECEPVYKFCKYVLSVSLSSLLVGIWLKSINSLGIGCGSVGKVVSSDIRDPVIGKFCLLSNGLKSRQNEKRGGNGPFQTLSFHYINLKVSKLQNGVKQTNSFSNELKMGNGNEANHFGGTFIAEILQ